MKSRLIALAFTAGTTLAAAQSLAEGEVRKVDAAQQRITLKHGEIKNVDLPPGVMAFAVKDSAMLGKVKPGDKVRFSADKLGGSYTLTSIEASK